jgi:hypothetical protein
LASLVAHLPVHVLRRFRHESDKRKTKVLCELHLEDPVFVPPPGDSRGEEDEDVGEVFFYYFYILFCIFFKYFLTNKILFDYYTK